MGAAYVRQRSVSEFPALKWINNSDLKKYERKDNEIFYMKEVFHEYFNLRKVPDYDYDFEDFLKWTETLHPNIGRLLKIFKNPYEPQTKEIVKIIHQDMPVNIKKPGGMLDIKIEVRNGPLGETVSQKKVMLSWTLANLKNLIMKTMKYPIKCQKLSLRAREGGEEEPMDD